MFKIGERYTACAPEDGLPVKWEIIKNGMLCIDGNNGWCTGQVFKESDISGFWKGLKDSVDNGSFVLDKEHNITRILNKIDNG